MKIICLINNVVLISQAALIVDDRIFLEHCLFLYTNVVFCEKKDIVD